MIIKFCVICNKQLTGKQQTFCSSACRIQLNPKRQDVIKLTNSTAANLMEIRRLTHNIMRFNNHNMHSKSVILQSMVYSVENYAKKAQLDLLNLQRKICGRTTNSSHKSSDIIQAFPRNFKRAK